MANKRFHYGWVICFISMLAMFFAVGAISTAFSTVSALIYDRWGITHTQSSILITMRDAGAIVAVAISAAYFKKLSLRYGLALAMFLGATGYLLLCLGNIYIGYVGMFIMGFCRGFGGTVGVALLVNNWFKKYRGSVLAACTVGSGFTTAIFPIAITFIVQNSNLNVALMSVGGVFAVTGVLMLLLARDTPQSMGLERVGEHEKVSEKKRRSTYESYAPNNFHCTLMLVACFLISSFTLTQGSFRTIHLTTLGWSTSAAAIATSAYGIWVVIGKVIYGPLTDRIPMRKCTSFLFMTLVASHLIYAMAILPSFNMMWVYAACIFYGIGGPVCTIGLSLYGYEMCKDGDVTSWVRNYSLVYNIGGLVFSPLTGIIADLTGNYSAAYIMYAVLAAVAMVLVQIAYIGAYERAKATPA